MDVFTVLGVVAFAVFVLAGVRAHVSHRKLLDARRALLIEGGDVEAWFEAIGLEMAPSKRSDVSRGVALGGDLAVTLGCTSMADFNAVTRLEVSLDLSQWVDPRVSLTGTRWHHDGHQLVYEQVPITAFSRRRRASQLFDFNGGEAAVVKLMASVFGGHLLSFYLLFSVDHSYVSFGNGVLRVTHSSPLFVLEDEGHETMTKVMENLRGLHQGMSASEPVDDLAEVVRSPDWFADARVRAAGVLATHYPREPATRALAAALDDLDREGLCACALHGASGPFRLPAHQRYRALRPFAREDSIGDRVAEVLERELAWNTLTDVTLPAYMRMNAAPRAWRSSDAPDSDADRDAALASLFTSPESIRALSLSIVFDQLTAGGWKPGPEAARLIATDGDRTGREKLMEFIEGRPNKRAYAGALAALKDAKVSGAARLFDRLDLSKAGGTLSLAEGDATRGGLSQAAERGSLSPHDEDG